MEGNINYQQITVDVPEDRVAEFHAFFARFLEGPMRRGRRRHGHGPHSGHGHHHGRGRRCGDRRESSQAEQAETPQAQTEAQQSESQRTEL